MPVATVRVALLCLSVIMFPACSQGLQPGKTSSPDSFAREWLDAWSSHDIDRLLTFYTEDAILTDVAIVENRNIAPPHGHQEIGEFLASMFEDMPDLGFALVSASGAGDRMVVEWIMTGTQFRHFSGRFSIRGVSVIELKEGKIATETDYYDAYLLMKQLGMVPGPGTEQPEAHKDSTPQ